MPPIRRALALVACLAAVPMLWPSGATPASPKASAGGFLFYRYQTPQPVCDGVAVRGQYFTKDDCGFAVFRVADLPEGDKVFARLVGPGGEDLGTQEAPARDSPGEFEAAITPRDEWPAGEITLEVLTGPDQASATEAGQGQVFVNALGVSASADAKSGGGPHTPGDEVRVTGSVFEQRSVGTGVRREGVAGTLRLRVVTADGDVRGPYGVITAAEDGSFAFTLPSSATAGLDPDRTTDYRTTVRVEAVAVRYEDPRPGIGGGTWAAPDGTPAGGVQLAVTPDELVLENRFTSSVGWVKPGETYPFTLRVKNFSPTARSGAEVTLTEPEGTDLGTTTWDVGTVPAATADGPGVRTFVGEATADTLAEDPQVVWRNLSTTATLTYAGGPSGLTSQSHGPKVIPPQGGYETARYGDRPFPVVPVEYQERKHDPATSGADKLATIINDPDEPGSTFNLFQEISYGQLFPDGAVPSASIASASWDYEPGFSFQRLAPNPREGDTCRGVTAADAPGGPRTVSPERIRDGWYQLPGTTDFYGDDSKGSALVGAVTGIGALQDIDSACGPTGKLVFDAAQIADPEIDYSDYDTDKDGVVDFFMVVFAGQGGNGDSQINGTPPYDNVWPHSFDLRSQFTDAATGLAGYVSDDQLRDLEDRPLWYTDESRTETTTEDKGDALKVLVRVGPYNVNPETAIERASVISHEYGHSLGLPDYYSTGDRETYGTWNLMASDHSQHIDVIGKKELGWVVPRVLEAGATVAETGWDDTKTDIGEIRWKDPTGTPYTLSGAGVHNGLAYYAPLPGRQIIDPALVPSGDHVWWSQAGNDFGCAPEGGHNLDIALPALREVAAGTPVTVTFKSRWDIEWDYDFGFVLTTEDGESYTSHASEHGYTTPATQNPRAISCQARYGNGITGSSGSYEGGTQAVDRVLDRYPRAPFVEDSYDISELAGKGGALRFSYTTDGGLARPGWFIDDVEVKAGDTVIYSSDFEASRDTAIFNGGCREGLQTAKTCTDGWQYTAASDGSSAEHAYLLEMRDRSGFDLDGRGESDRGDPTFAPGLLLTYTDENRGYGNVGTSNPPAQSPLDSQPEPGSDTPDLDDAAFTAADGDDRFSDSGGGHVDNYGDPSREDELWRFDFDCLAFDVTAMSGEGVGPSRAPGDLTGDVAFRTGDGCGTFDYGSPGLPPAPNVAPTAVATAKPTTVAVGEPVSFDATGSSDDRQAPDALAYGWDLDGDGTEDATGSAVRHAYTAPGDYTARLTVRDAEGLTGSATVPVKVTGGTDPGTGTGAGTGSGTGTGTGAGSGAGTTAGACMTDAGFRVAQVRRVGSGVRFAVDRRLQRPFGVDVFRSTKGSRVTRGQLVARFTGRSGSFRWSARRDRAGRALGDGIYFARFRMRLADGTSDVRRVTLLRRRGRFLVLGAFHRRASCDVLRSFKLSGPAFGGRSAAKLGVAYRLAEAAEVRVEVLRGSRVVKRTGFVRRAADRTFRTSLSARGAARGVYTVRLTIRRGGRTTVARLVSRRI